MHIEYLNFVNNIKHKELLNLIFAEDKSNGKILTDNIIGMKEIFNVREIVDKLTEYVNIVIDSLVFQSEEYKNNIYSCYSDLIKDCYSNFAGVSIAEKIKKGIDLVEKITYFMIKTVQNDVNANICFKIIGQIKQ